jgi:hypothetical protein
MLNYGPGDHCYKMTVRFKPETNRNPLRIFTSEEHTVETLRDAFITNMDVRSIHLKRLSIHVEEQKI